MATLAKNGRAEEKIAKGNNDAVRLRIGVNPEGRAAYAGVLVGPAAIGHGATATAMSHIAIQEKLNGSPVDWMEQVSDADYRCSEPLRAYL
jgi:hypothetical protein